MPNIFQQWKQHILDIWNEYVILQANVTYFNEMQAINVIYGKHALLVTWLYIKDVWSLIWK